MRLDLVSNRVLIFGAKSFTAKHLIPYLQSSGFDTIGSRVNILDRGDILREIKKYSPNYIINLAGLSFVADSNSLGFYSVNTIGAINILDILVKNGITPKKIILVSSATVYGNQDRAILDESLHPEPINHYGNSKLSMENLAKNYFDKLNITIARPFNYTGVGQSSKFLIPKIVNHYRDRRETIELGNLNIIREFNDIEFLSETYRRLLIEDSASGEILNICSGRGIKLLDIIDIMDKIAGYSIDVRVNPKFIRKDEIESLTGSPKKLFSIVGEVSQKDFKETLKDMFEA
ncbi:MAG: NAD-dependent epimerase/dehydratase family protein [Epsilonproteobacteria bacterium]|nr:NAD-dependent epimerase/dehydratase family protein [Campylobacterota bacterium]